MNQPTFPVADLVQLLDPASREAFEERAAIIEFDANQPRDHAECLALIEQLRRNPAALLGMTVLQIECERKTRFVLTTDVEFAQQHLTALDAEIVRRVDPAKLIAARFSGIALLTRIG